MSDPRVAEPRVRLVLEKFRDGEDSPYETIVEEDGVRTVFTPDAMRMMIEDSRAGD